MIAFSGIRAEPALPNSAPPHRADMKSNSFAISVVSTLPAFTPTHSVRVAHASSRFTAPSRAARSPDEQRTARHAFELGDALADRGRRELAVFGCFRQAAVLGDKREHAQRLQIEMKRVHHVMGPGKAVPAHAVSAAA